MISSNLRGLDCVSQIDVYQRGRGIFVAIITVSEIMEHGRLYYIDAHSVGLDALRKRLQASDLIPSHLPLLERLAENLALLRQADICSLGDLRDALKTKKSAMVLAARCNVDGQYLLLLRRAINGFFPKPKDLNDFVWLDMATVGKLAMVGVNNTQQLFDGVAGDPEFAKKAGVTLRALAPFLEYSDLCRIQWVSPTFARVMISAGITDADSVAKSDPEELCDAIGEANKKDGLYKAKVGLRDIKRLVVAASYVD